ncbi:MAG: creatininase family protein [Paenibacillaceae bacterium]|nr:creatininase family protein [Paenibacillaceae bacterium]
MSGRSIFFHHYTRAEISEMAGQGAAVVVPLAATEQHGDHLPVYTDSFICDHIVRRSVDSASASVPIVMAPLVSIGCSQHHLSFGGTISFPSATYLLMLGDIAESLVRCGFRKIIFVNGHGGNHALMNQAAQDLAVRHPVWTAAASYWNVAKSALVDAGAKEVGKVPGHAGGFETSLIMALVPELVKRERIALTHREHMRSTYSESGIFIAKHGELTGIDGFTDAAGAADAAKGVSYLQTIVESVSRWLIDVYGTMSEISGRQPSSIDASTPASP